MGTIRNIALLDARKATEESLKKVTDIENVALLICSEKTATLLENIRKSAISRFITIPQELDLDIIKVNGSCNIDGPFLEGIAEQAYIAVNGECSIKDIDMEHFRKKIYRIDVNGVIECPDYMKATVMGKGSLNGSINSYPKGYKPIWDTFVITEHNVLPYNKAKLCIDTLVAILPIEEAIQDYIERIKVNNTVYVTKGNLPQIKELVDNLDAIELIVVPEDSLFRKEKVYLKPETIANYESKTLIVDSNVYVEELTKEQLEEHIAGIYCEKIYCEPTMENTVRNLLRNDARVMLNVSNAISNMGKMVINQAYLEGITEERSIENLGKLVIDDDVDPELFAEKITGIENLGKITGSSSVLSGVKINNLGKVDMSDKESVDRQSEDVLYEDMSTLVL